MSAELKTYSNKYELFSWIRINSYKGLVVTGAFFYCMMRLCLRKQFQNYCQEYYDYVNRSQVFDPPRHYIYAFFACRLIHGAVAKEFFLYDFIHLNDRGRRQYITEISRYKIYQTYNGAKKRIEMQDKYLAYKAFQKFYKRDAIYITKDSKKEELEAFFSNRDGCIMKPNYQGCGRGIEIVRISDFPSREEAFAYILSMTDHILEELVVQSDVMHALHPQSVNTVRVYACRTKQGIEIFGSHLRIGLNDSVVDNAAQGGICVSITNDGYAWTSGVDEFGNIYLYHPNTNAYIPGMRLPQWEEAVKLVKEAMDVYPDIRFVGWDIAHTDSGWIIIEANDNAQFYGAQIPHHRGFRREIDKFLKESWG